VDGEATESAKGGTLNRRELINAVASTVDADAKEVERFLSGLTDTITSTVARGEQVAISGFAKFAKVERAARMGRNPATGEQIHIKASKKARITPLKAFKDAVMGGAAGGARKAAKKGAATKKAAAKKGATAKKAVAKKTTAKRSTAKKATAKRASARR
jgi:DNA-binding protein HU-beta